jgi:tetratricopeptide (TPR) repeat protein
LSHFFIYYYPAYVINFLEPEVAQDTPHRRFSMHATEALLTRAMNYHLFGLAYHVQSERETTPQKWWGVALRCLEDIKSKAPGDEVMSKVMEHEALIFLDIGFLNYTNRRNKHALLSYRSSVDSVATAQGYWRLGELFHAARELDTARGHLLEAMRMGGAGAYVMYDQKDSDFCIKPVAELLQFQKVAGFRVDLLAGYLLATIYQTQDNTTEADHMVECMEELVSTVPSALAYYILGCMYMDLRHEERAIGGMIDFHPTPILLISARVYLCLLAFHEGISMRSSLSLSCALRFCLAYVYESLEQYEEAETCYREILQMDLSLDPQGRRAKRTDIGVILRLGQAQYFQVCNE